MNNSSAINDVDVSKDGNPLDALAESFVVRYRNGERPALTEYTVKYPALADEIRELFPALVMMEDARPKVSEMADGFSGVGGTASGKTLERLGDYRILREVGRGGMGIVYEAEQESLGRHVALKVLPLHSMLDPRHLQRFAREARAAARLHHTNIVPVFGVGEQDGLHYYVMQFIQGLGLDEVLADLKRLRDTERSTHECDHPRTERVAHRRSVCSNGGSLAAVETTKSKNKHDSDFCASTDDTRQKQSDLGCATTDSSWRVRPVSDLSSSGVQLSAPEAHASLTDSGRDYWHGVARVGVQVAEALAYAHSQGVLHRDIKPSNLLLDTQGTVWVTDFGLAKATGNENLTHTGDIIGTLRYLAPERLCGDSDERSDIYSLGATLYELLTFRSPFEEQDRATLVGQILHGEPTRPRDLDSEIPLDLETIVLKAIAKEPEDRYSTPFELAEDLRRFLTDRPIRARRPALWERTWRLCRRNPLSASLVAALILVLPAGLAGTTWKWQEAVQARRAEQVARQKADDQAQENAQGLKDLQRAHILLDRGRFYTELNRWDDADRTFTEAIRLRPDYGNAWEARGQLYSMLGLFDMAAFDLTKAFEFHKPVVSWRWYAQALLHLNLGEPENYRRVCDQMRQHFEGSSGRSPVMDLLRTWALVPQSTADLSKILEAGESVVDSHSDAWFRYVLGVANYRLGRHDQAVRRLQESLTSDSHWPARPIGYPVLAMAYYRQGNIDLAKQALRDATQVLEQWTQQMYSPRNGDYWPVHQGAEATWPIPRWEWLEFRRNYRDAMILIDGTPPPTDSRLIVLRARALAGLRRREMADAEYAAALKVSSEDPLIRFEAHRNRAYFYANRSKWEQAAAEFGLARELAPDQARLWQTQANVYLAAKDFPAYRRTCAAMVEWFRQTKDPRTAHYVVFACVTRPDALPEMRELIPLAELAAPWHHGNVRMLGAAHYRSGDYAKAVACLEASTRVYHPRAWELSFLAMAYYHSGEHQKARHHLAQAQSWMNDAKSGAVDNLSGVQQYIDTWEESVEFPILLREAVSLIDGAPDESLPFTPPRF